MSERQCRICGEWKSIEENYSYSPHSRQHYWCKSCWETYKSMRADGEDAVPWIRKQQNKWDYVIRKVNPDR